MTKTLKEMNSFINYIIESGISLGLLSLIYFVFLRNETFFKANRIFLLFAVVFSSILPLLHFKILYSAGIVLPEASVGTPTMLETVTVYGSGFSGFLTQLISTNNLILFGYMSISVLFALLLAYRILLLVKTILKGRLVQKEGIKFVYINEDSSPYSFLDYLFVSNMLENNPAWEKMLAHETEHIRQGHTVDILVLELISIFQWFNPFFWMLRRVIKENHEYMADRAVLNKGVTVDIYKKILVTQCVGNQFSMANNFNSSLIKSRLKMMTKIKSSKLASLRFISGAIVALALLLVFACEQKEMPEPETQTGFLNEKGVFISSLTNDPLILIDGEMATKDAMNKLNPEDIQSVSVVKTKDLKYVAKYGSKAQNGVIDIILKSGATDAQNVDEVVVVAYNKGGMVATDPVFNIVEEMPVFPGGELALRQFIAKSVKYPVIAQEQGIQGKVYVSFVIEKDGAVGRLKIARGVDASLDSEALRVVNNLPKWKPGKQRGEVVAVSYTMPISFVLQ